MNRSDAKRRTSRQRLTAVLAAYLLAFGWAHVWLHNAGDGQGHFSTEVAAQCLLAKLPVQLLPDSPSCAVPDGLGPVVAAAAETAFPRVAARLPEIRAPPLS